MKRNLNFELCFRWNGFYKSKNGLLCAKYNIVILLDTTCFGKNINNEKLPVYVKII